MSESLRTGTGSLSILVASLRAKVSLIFSTCFGRNEGNDNSAKHTVPPLRFFAIAIVIVAADGADAKLAVRATMFSFAHPPGKLALPSRLPQLQLQLQRTLLSSSLSVDKICGGGVLLKKKKNLNVVRYWASRTGPETLRGLLSLKKIYVSKFALFFNVSLPIDCLMIYYVSYACKHISQ